MSIVSLKGTCKIEKIIITENQELFIKFINIFFLLIIGIVIIFTFHKNSEQLEWLTYAISAISIFLASFIASYFINLNKVSLNFYRMILLINLFFLFFLVFQLYTQKILPLKSLLFMLLSFIPFIENYYSKNLSTYKAKGAGGLLSINCIKDNHHFIEIILINIIAIIAVMSYFSISISTYPISEVYKIIAVTIIVSFIFLYKVKYIDKTNKINPAIFLLFLLPIIFIIIQKSVDYHHYSFYVGPTLDVIKGKSLLIDTPSQYGYLSIHFLAFILSKIGLSFSSFHLVNTLLSCLFFLLACYIFLKLIKNRCLAVICAIVFITLQTIFSYHSNSIYPSTGPLRFGFGLLIIYFLLYKPNQINFILGSIFASISLFWSVETATYIVPAWVAVCFTYSYISTDTTKKFIKSSISKISLFLLISVLIFSLIILKEYFFKHTFPNIQNYFEYVLLYARGFGSLPIPLYGNYYLAVIIMVLGIVVTIHLITKNIKTTLLPILSFISVHNVAIFSYFISRSHENNIVNISGFIVIEAVIIIKIITDVLKIDVTLLKKMIAIPVILFVVLYAFRLPDQTIKQYKIIQDSLIKNISFLFNPKTHTPILSATLTKYNLNNKPIIVLNKNKETLLLVESNLKNELPLNPSTMTAVLPNWQNKYIDPSLNKIQLHTVIAVDAEITNSSLNLVWEKILNKYNLKKICEIKEENLIIYEIIPSNYLYSFVTQPFKDEGSSFLNSVMLELYIGGKNGKKINNKAENISIYIKNFNPEVLEVSEYSDDSGKILSGLGTSKLICTTNIEGYLELKFTLKKQINQTFIIYPSISEYFISYPEELKIFSEIQLDNLLNRN